MVFFLTLPIFLFKFSSLRRIRFDCGTGGICSSLIDSTLFIFNFLLRSFEHSSNRKMVDQLPVSNFQVLNDE